MSLSIPIFNIALMIVKFFVIFTLSAVATYFALKFIPSIPAKCKKYTYTLLFVFLLAYLVIFPVLGGLHQPKLKIDNIVKPAQIEYNKTKEVTIITPEPRTKKLDGFDKDMDF